MESLFKNWKKKLHHKFAGNYHKMNLPRMGDDAIHATNPGRTMGGMHSGGTMGGMHSGGMMGGMHSGGMIHGGAVMGDGGSSFHGRKGWGMPGGAQCRD